MDQLLHETACTPYFSAQRHKGQSGIHSIHICAKTGLVSCSTRSRAQHISRAAPQKSGWHPFDPYPRQTLFVSCSTGPECRIFISEQRKKRPVAWVCDSYRRRTSLRNAFWCQLAVGRVTESITSTCTGPMPGTNLRPSCSSRAVKIETAAGPRSGPASDTICSGAHRRS